MRRTAGFTLIELVVVILIGSILVSVALSGVQGAQEAYAVRSARTMYATFHQKARAKAIESGRTQIIIVDTTGDSVMIADWEPPAAPVFTDVTRLREQLNVDMRATPVAFLMCMTPRGYADAACPAFPGITGSTGAIRLEFWLNGDSTSTIILPMGQLVGT